MRPGPRQLDIPPRTSREQARYNQRKTNKVYGVYLAANRSSSTRSAYAGDVRRYLDRGGRLPATPHDVATYLAANAGQLSISTLARQLVAIRHAHTELNLPNPVNHPLVRQTLRGIRRVHGTALRQAHPLSKEVLSKILPKKKTLVDLRDRALLLVGFCGGFRRSELTALDVDDIRFVDQGLLIHLPRCKTDQEGNGRLVALPYGPRRLCPVLALQAWLDALPITSGPVFFRLDNAVFATETYVRLDAAYVGKILRNRLSDKGYAVKGFSAHSLRAGLVTSAAELGIAGWKIRKQTGHKSDAMVQIYIRNQRLFEENAAGAVLRSKSRISSVQFA